MNIQSFFPYFSGWGVLLYFFFACVLFLVIREIVTWYWKLNRIEDLLEKIDENTRKEKEAKSIAKSDKVL